MVHQAESGCCLLACDANVGLVVAVAQAQGSIHHDGEEGVHGADVVQHVVVLKDDADQNHQEVQPPHHLAEPAGTTWSCAAEWTGCL